jgi:hypothetical protein
MVADRATIRMMADVFPVIVSFLGFGLGPSVVVRHNFVRQCVSVSTI